MTVIKKFLPGKKTILLLIIFLTALFLRIGYIRYTIIDSPLRADTLEYVIYGYNIAHHRTFSIQQDSENPLPDSKRTPGYPLFIALTFLIDEQNSYKIILYIQAALSALMAVLTFYLGNRFLQFRWAIAGALLVTFSPHLVSMTGYVLSETLFGFVLLIGITLFYQALKRKSLLLFAASALFFGYSYITTPTIIFIPFFLAAVVFIFRGFVADTKAKNSVLKHIIIFLIVYSLFPVGWGIRNRINVPSDALKGSGRLKIALALGAYPGYVYKNPLNKYYPNKDDPQWEEFSGSIKGFSKIFRERFLERPLRFIVWYLFEKPYVFWSWSILQGQGDVYVYPVITSLYQKSELANLTRIIIKFIHPFVQLLMLGGIPLFYYTFVSKRQKNNPENLSESPIFILVIILYYTLFFMVLGPLTRYAVPLRPEQYLWALWSLNTGLILIRDRKSFSVSNDTKTISSGKNHVKKIQEKK